MSFVLDNGISEKIPEKTKVCLKCSEEKPESFFRTYGKGRRTTCIDCEDLAKEETKEETTDTIKIKSSLGFSAEFVDGDTYVIKQGKNMIEFQPHEAYALIEWLKERMTLE